MARDGHGLPKVSLGPAMSCPSMPCWWGTPEKSFCLFQGWPACRAGGQRRPSTSLDTPRRTTMFEIMKCGSILFISVHPHWANTYQKMDQITKLGLLFWGFACRTPTLRPVWRPTLGWHVSQSRDGRQQGIKTNSRITMKLKLLI
jgi:hypothetical protein